MGDKADFAVLLRPLVLSIIIIIIIIVLFRMKQHNIIIQMSIKNINKRHVKIHMK